MGHLEIESTDHFEGTMPVNSRVRPKPRWPKEDYRSQFMKGLTLSAKEQNRLQVLNGLLSGQWCMSEAAQAMGVSERHGWRLLAA